MYDFREIILNLRLSLIQIIIDNDPDYFFGLGCVWFENKKTFMGRSLLSFRLDKGYGITCYMDVLFFRIYFKSGLKKKLNKNKL